MDRTGGNQCVKIFLRFSIWPLGKHNVPVFGQWFNFVQKQKDIYLFQGIVMTRESLCTVLVQVQLQ